MKLLLCLIFLITIGCASNKSDDNPVIPPSNCFRSVHYTFHVDPKFLFEERAAILEASYEWFVFSQGRVQFDILFDYGPEFIDSAKMIRLESWMPEVKTQESYESEKYSEPVSLAGWADHVNHIYIVIDKTDKNHLFAVMAHELGHVAGLRWPGCDSSREECIHSSDPESVMALITIASKFNSEDLRLCRVSCVCP
jgi:hypothetical protein